MTQQFQITCLVPACKKRVGGQTKGLCMSCYSKAKKKVDAGETTWEELADMGLAAKQADPFEQAFNAKKGGAGA